jgi:hypothetical protein
LEGEVSSNWHYGMDRRVLWLKVWFSIGVMFIHSVDDGFLKALTHPREDANPSQINHRNRRTDRNEIKDPREETMFHVVKASG